MIYFFENPAQKVYAVQSLVALTSEDTEKLNWLFGNASLIEQQDIKKSFVGPRAAMVTPWSTNAVEITQNMGINGLIRIEEFEPLSEENAQFDHMIFQNLTNSTKIFTTSISNLKKYWKLRTSLLTTNKKV